MAQLKISKLDAARRQLETAIRLYFSNGDPVSIHTLTLAAYNVIRDTNVARGGEPMLVKDTIIRLIKPEYRKMMRDKFNEAENFFKHADRDHGDALDFNPEMSGVFLLDACDKYYELTGEDLPMCMVFRWWYMANYPSFFKLPDDQKRMLGAASQTIVELGRAGFFNMMLPAAMNLKT